MADLIYQAAIIDGKSQLIVFDDEKHITVSEPQIMKWNDEIEQKARELYPSTGRILSSKARENMICGKIKRLFE